MRKVGCVLVLGALVAAGCQRANPDAGVPDGASPETDLASPSPPADLAPTEAGDLAPWPAPDLLPPVEAVSVCPVDQQMDSGTNTVVRVHAAWLIDRLSLSPSSLGVQLGGTPIAGSVAVSGQDLVFTATAPLPANATLQASLAADVRDTLGRPLAPTGTTWTFSTGAGAQPTVGFKFTPPVCPYLGDHALQHAVTRDGAQTIIAWSTGDDVVGTSLDADATDFVNPLIVSHDDIGFNGVSVTAVDGVATFAYAMTVNSPLVYWSRADDDWKMPASEKLLTTDEGNGPSVAAGSGGLLAIAWELGDIFDSSGYLTTSSDGGSSFSTPKALASGSECPQVLYQNGRLVVAWLDPGSVPVAGGLAIEAMSSSNNGASFSTPVTIAGTPSGVTCPQLVDGGNGDVLVLFDEGADLGGESVMLARYTPSTNAVATPIELYPPDGDNYQCTYLAASPSGKLLLAHSSGPNGGIQWATDLRTSDDGGQTFDASTTTDVVDPHGGCPLVTLTDDAQVTMAWRRDSLQLQVSRGHPRRPCE